MDIKTKWLRAKAEALDALERTANIKVRDAHAEWRAAQPDILTDPQAFYRWLDREPDRDEPMPVPVPQQQIITPAEADLMDQAVRETLARRKAIELIDARIAVTVESVVSKALVEHKTLDDARMQAVGEALGKVRKQLRDEFAAEIGGLRADHTIERAYARREPEFRGEIVDMQMPLERKRRA